MVWGCPNHRVFPTVFGEGPSKKSEMRLLLGVPPPKKKNKKKGGEGKHLNQKKKKRTRTPGVAPEADGTWESSEVSLRGPKELGLPQLRRESSWSRNRANRHCSTLPGKQAAGVTACKAHKTIRKPTEKHTRRVEIPVEIPKASPTTSILQQKSPGAD